jgi:hypothetical protein
MSSNLLCSSGESGANSTTSAHEHSPDQFLGAAVADEIVLGRQRAELADFRPARFFN